MKYRTDPRLIRTDFIKGRLRLSTGQRSVPADALFCELADFFREAQPREAFEGHDKPEVREAFQKMRDLGLLRSSESGPSAALPSLDRPGATMFNAPSRRIEDVQPGEIVFLGVPLDIGTTGIPGARFGPQALRAASSERYECVLDLRTGGLQPWKFPALGGAVLGGARLSDLGDLAYAPGAPVEAYYENLRSVLARLYVSRAFPVVLGGDHSITYATVPEHVPTLVHIDAHCDLAELEDGHCHHHGNVVRRLLDEGRTEHVFHLGLRDTSGHDTRAAGTQAFSVGDLERDGWFEPLSGRELFVSLDLDVLDPSVLPGTGTPVMGGLTLRQLCRLLVTLARQTRPVGLDIVELCPLLDPAGLSARTAVEAILCFLAAWHGKHAAPERVTPDRSTKVSRNDVVTSSSRTIFSRSLTGRSERQIVRQFSGP